MLDREASIKRGSPNASTVCDSISQLSHKGVTFWDEHMIKLTGIQSKDFS
jgi:hypothetical protein